MDRLHMPMEHWEQPCYFIRMLFKGLAVAWIGWIGGIGLTGMIPNVLASEQRPCPAPSEIKEMLSCVLRLHPEAQRASLRLEESRLLVDIAKQRPNPEFEAQTLGGGAYGQGQFQQSLGLYHVWELGGKRTFRETKATQQVSVTEAESLETKSSLVRLILMALHQIRIKERELHAVDESFGTFQKLIRQYEGRPRRSAEQEVSLSVFRLAAQDFQLRRTQILDALADLERVFMSFAGLELSEVRSLVPEGTRNWGELSTAPGGVDSAPELKILNSIHLFQESELNFQKALAYPDLRIGPSYQYVWDPTYAANSFGIKVSLPLPIFQANGAGVAQAAKGVETSGQRIQIKRREVQSERETLAKTYQTTLRALQSSTPIQVIEKRHMRIEALFLQGLVSSALLIEAHRQLVDLIRTTGERELRIVEIRTRVAEIDGTLMKEYL